MLCVASSIRDRIFEACGPQLLNVENALLPSTGEFILDKVLFGYDRSPDLPIDEAFDSILPGLIEADAVGC